MDIKMKNVYKKTNSNAELSEEETL